MRDGGQGKDVLVWKFYGGSLHRGSRARLDGCAEWGIPALKKVVLEQIPHLSMLLFIAAVVVTMCRIVHVRVSRM